MKYQLVLESEEEGEWMRPNRHGKQLILYMLLCFLTYQIIEPKMAEGHSKVWTHIDSTAYSIDTPKEKSGLSLNDFPKNMPETEFCSVNVTQQKNIKMMTVIIQQAEKNGSGRLTGKKTSKVIHLPVSGIQAISRENKWEIIISAAPITTSPVKKNDFSIEQKLNRNPIAIPIPEPASLLLLGIGMTVIVRYTRKFGFK